jgi:hypothetical protein
LGFLLDKCTLQVYTQSILHDCDVFDCENEDLNDFFANDVLNYTSQLLGKSYCFTLDENPKTIVAAFTISNDSIKTKLLPNSRKRKVIDNIPRPKHISSYPAVLIGRLGIHKAFRKLEGEEQKTGDQLMDFIKSWFVDGKNKTGCRFMVVDAYNTEIPLKFYIRNNFLYLFSTEAQEKEFTGVQQEEVLKTRLMYYDLIVLSS